MFFIVFIGVSKKNMYCAIFSLTFFSIFLAFSQLFLALRLHRELESKAGKRTPKTRTLKKTDSNSFKNVPFISDYFHHWKITILVLLLLSWKCLKTYFTVFVSQNEKKLKQIELESQYLMSMPICNVRKWKCNFLRPIFHLN